MKKTFILFIILFVLFPLSACKEPNFKEATLTIDKKEKEQEAIIKAKKFMK